MNESDEVELSVMTVAHLAESLSPRTTHPLHIPSSPKSRKSIGWGGVRVPRSRPHTPCVNTLCRCTRTHYHILLTLVDGFFTGRSFRGVPKTRGIRYKMYWVHIEFGSLLKQIPLRYKKERCIGLFHNKTTKLVKSYRTKSNTFLFLSRVPVRSKL